MKVYRLAKERPGSYLADDLSGVAAALTGVRWNPRGIPVLYTCVHASTSVLEAVIKMAGLLPRTDFFLVTLDVPDDLFVNAYVPDLPADWRELTRDCEATAEIGRSWAQRGRHVAMRVPSVACPVDFNLLLNPKHPHMARVKVVCKEVFRPDPQMFH
ncbi:MAG: hypothetical protein GAK40_00734 [Burkholderia plantarii]|nr:MAG: hypothetical protein GAK40_00734 [Burkholderia plantarii]